MRSSTSSQPSCCEVGVDRHLRVDDDALAARQLHDHVGPKQAAGVVALALLLVEVAVLDHPCELDDALQLHLAPAAAHVWRPQCGHEVAGLGAEPLLALGHGAQLLADDRHGRQPLLLECLRLGLEAQQRLLDRRELRLGQFEQGGLALRERLAADRLEALLPLRLGALEEGDRLGGRGALPLDRCLFRTERRSRPEPDGACADGKPDDEEDG